MIALTINGNATKLEDGTTLDQFLQCNSINSKYVAVAYNGNVLRCEEFKSVTLAHGDSLEIVRPVGGG